MAVAKLAGSCQSDEGALLSDTFRLTSGGRWRARGARSNGQSDDRYDTVAQLLALLPHSKKVMGSIPAWGAVGSGGQVLTRVQSAQVGYLPGLSVWSLHVLNKGFPPLRTPTVKTCKITELMSIPDQRWTVHFTWSPGAAKLPTAPGGG